MLRIKNIISWPTYKKKFNKAKSPEPQVEQQMSMSWPIGYTIVYRLHVLKYPEHYQLIIVYTTGNFTIFSKELV